MQMLKQKAIYFAILTSTLAGGLFLGGCTGENVVTENTSDEDKTHQEGMPSPRDDSATFVGAAPSNVMSQGGLVRASGGAHIELLTAGSHEIHLPIPQLADAQVPVCYYISTKPPNAATEFRLLQREDSNVVVSVWLKGERNQEVQIDWSSVILIAKETVTPNNSEPDPFLAATACPEFATSFPHYTKKSNHFWRPAANLVAFDNPPAPEGTRQGPTARSWPIPGSLLIYAELEARQRSQLYLAIISVRPSII